MIRKFNASSEVIIVVAIRSFFFEIKFTWCYFQLFARSILSLDFIKRHNFGSNLVLSLKKNLFFFFRAILYVTCTLFSVLSPTMSKSIRFDICFLLRFRFLSFFTISFHNLCINRFLSLISFCFFNYFVCLFVCLFRSLSFFSFLSIHLIFPKSSSIFNPETTISTFLFKFLSFFLFNF